MLSNLPKKTTRAALGVALGVALGAAVVTVAAAAQAQSTVIIGGSGQSNVVVNLDVLEPGGGGVANLSPTGRILRMPGETMGGAVKLRMPGEAMGSAGGATMPRFKLKPPTMLKRQPVKLRALKRKKPKPIAMPQAMPKAKVPAVAVAPMKKQATSAPRKITKPAPVVPAVPAAPKPAAKPILKAATPPPPPAPSVIAAKPAAQPKPIAKPVGKKQVAALPPATRPGKDGVVSRINFTGASTRLSPEAKQQLQALAGRISAAGDRLQLKAYAGGTGDSSSSARRLSLSRALAVRSFLIQSGVRSTRIDVRALGRAADSGPPDRVDMILLVR